MTCWDRDSAAPHDANQQHDHLTFTSRFSVAALAALFMASSFNEPRTRAMITAPSSPTTFHDRFRDVSVFSDCFWIAAPSDLIPVHQPQHRHDRQHS